MISRNMELMEDRINVLPGENSAPAAKELLGNFRTLLKQAQKDFNKLDRHFRDSVKDSFLQFSDFMNNKIFDL